MTPARVLVVDDDAALRAVLRGMLEDHGFDVVGEAANGRDGVAQAVALRPDIAMLDLRMPEMDGIAAARRIGQVCPEVRCVVLSAYNDGSLRTDAAGAGVYAYLVKGCSARLIRDVLNAAWRHDRVVDPEAALG